MYLDVYETGIRKNRIGNQLKFFIYVQYLHPKILCIRDCATNT